MNYTTIKLLGAKKLIISTLLLLASITTQVKSDFIRGAVYVNEKTDQIIVVLGDIHMPLGQTKIQHDQIIKELKKFYKKSNITLVEDSSSSEVYKNNAKYQSILKKIESVSSLLSQKNPTIAEVTSPLTLMHSDLIKQNLNVENIECRYMEIQLQNEMAISEIAESTQSITPIPEITLKEVLNEIEQNLENHKKQVEKILELEKISGYENLYDQDGQERQDGQEGQKGYDKLISYFKKSVKELPISFEKYMKFLRETHLGLKDNHLKLCANSGKKLPKLATQIKKLETIIDDNMANQFCFVDTNIFANILKNNDKKIIVVCAGADHIRTTESFIKDLGYKLIKEMGPDTDWGLVSLGEIFNHKPKPINVAKLFSHQKIQGLRPQKNISKIFTPKEKTPLNIEKMPKIFKSGEKTPLSVEKMLGEIIAYLNKDKSPVINYKKNK